MNADAGGRGNPEAGPVRPAVTRLADDDPARAISGKLDDVPVENIRTFEDGFRDYLMKTRRDIVDAIEKEMDLSDDTKKKIEEAVAEYKKINA